MFRVQLRERVRKHPHPMVTDPTDQDPGDEDGSIKRKKRSATKAKHWRKKLKENANEYDKFKEFDALRSKVYRLNMTEDKRNMAKEKARERQRKFRERRKAEKDQPKCVKLMTRSLTEHEEKLREYNRVKKREERANMSAQKKRRINEGRRKKYSQAKAKCIPSASEPSTSENNTPASTPASSLASTPARRKRLSRAIKTLPMDASRYAETVQDLICKASPRKKAALKLRSVIDGEEDGMNATAVRSMKHFIASLKSKRTKRDHQLKRLLAKSLNISAKFLSKPDKVQRKRKDAITHDQQKLVQSFLENHATMLPGKKTVSKKSQKQTVVLQQSLISLYKAFQLDENSFPIAFSTFAKLRPKHVKLAKHWKLFQCLCEYCENAKYLLESANNVVQSVGCGQECRLSDQYRLIDATLCMKGEDGYHKKECIERKCSDCGVAMLSTLYGPVLENNSETACTWKRWIATKMRNEKKDKDITVKQLTQQSGTVKEMISCLSEDTKPLARHLFTAYWQQKQFASISKNPPANSVIQVLDFAENYTCQYQHEIQSVHWHHSTVTLHPIVCYYRCPDCETGVVCETLAFISDDKVHDYHAVQQFVSLAMQHLQHHRHLNVQRVIQWTDGCASQYKSKGPFSDISHSTTDLGCTQLERHFFGSRHGKGPSDGMSGIIKHHVDTAVKACQVVVQNAKEMFIFLQQTFTKDPEGPCAHSRRVFFYVETEDITRPRSARMVKTVTGTRDIHSVRSTDHQNFTLDVRQLSCLCLECQLQSGSCNNDAHVRNWQRIELTPVNKGTIDILFQILFKFV